jgi:hypothetical protein
MSRLSDVLKPAHRRNRWDLYAKVEGEWQLLLQDVPIGVVADKVCDNYEQHITEYGLRVHQ